MSTDTLNPYVARSSSKSNDIEHDILYILHVEYILQTTLVSTSSPLHKPYLSGMPVSVLSM